VFLKRHRKLALAAVVLLLAFSGLDLAGDVFGASICAADADPGRHVDDCFCCSGCVENPTSFSIDRGLWLTSLVPSVRAASPSTPPSELFRPPRAS
jgi:hypothetical protein